MKMKNLIMFAMVFLMMVVTAQVLGTRDFEVDINQTSKDALIEEGIIDPEYTDYVCKGDKCYYKIYQILPDNSTYNLGEHNLPRYKCTEFNETDLTCLTSVEHTVEELNTMQEPQAEKWLEDLGYHFDKEKSEPVKTVIPNHGTITINERGG